MNSAHGHGVSGAGDENSSRSRKRKTYHRHTAYQTQQLEEFFKECPHPDDMQRNQLSKDLGLDPQQIKFWFQNKRTQKKTMNGRAENNALRTENERLRRENMCLKESPKNITCLNCGQDSTLQIPGQSKSMVTLQKENLKLKQDINYLLQQEKRACIGVKSPAASPGSNSFANTLGTYFPVGNGNSDDVIPQNLEVPRLSPYPSIEFHENDRKEIIETVYSAMNEVIELLQVNEPMWMSDERRTLHRDSYDKLYPKPNHFKSANARMESSKDSGEVAMGGAQLVQVFLDPIKWKDMFSTIVTKASTLEVLDASPMFPNGSVHLMYEKIHIMSPLVVPREFFFIRYVQQVAITTWVMVDVSYDFIKQLQDAAPTRSWKLPSGCMIEDKSNGKSFVTWMEHVEVDDKSLTHRLFKDLAGQTYGAKRWITTLQRMCNRFACSMGLATAPRHDLEGVIPTFEGRRNLMRLSHRMVKSLAEILSMSDRLEFPHVPELNNSGVRVSIRKSNGTGQPEGLIVAAATSLLLPFTVQDLFYFFSDETKRAEWDILSAGSPVKAIARISTGTDSGNCISIIQPFVAPKENLLMLQESSIDSLGASLVYAPIDITSITSIVDGEDITRTQILPSGYLISSDGRPDKGSNESSISGSILTVIFQILACSILKSEQLNMETFATVHSLISSTVQNIKVALGVPDLE